MRHPQEVPGDLEDAFYISKLKASEVSTLGHELGHNFGLNTRTMPGQNLTETKRLMGKETTVRRNLSVGLCYRGPKIRPRGIQPGVIKIDMYNLNAFAQIANSKS